jgi:hypothetical protein
MSIFIISLSLFLHLLLSPISIGSNRFLAHPIHQDPYEKSKKDDRGKPEQGKGTS